MSRSGRVSVVALGVILGGCLDLPSIQYETEEAVIGTDLGVPLCEGDLARIDRQIAFVEDMLDAASDEKVEIYIYEGEPPRCHGGLSCYDARRKMIRTNMSSLDHEIVHAVVDRFATPRVFWSEGIATALDGNGTHRGSATVRDSQNVKHAFDLDYATAGHFTRWLLEEYDPAKIRPVIEGGSFSEHYGVSFDEAAERFEQEQPFAYPPWFTCEHPALEGEPGTWAESFEVGCGVMGGSSVRGGPFSVQRTVELAPGWYEIKTTGGLGTRLLGCQLDVFDDEPPEMVHGDLPNQVESSQTHPGVLFASGSAERFEVVEAGLFEVVVMAEESGASVDIVLESTGA